ncbi:hypothetical protein PMG71_01025 [Roseofilum sp. BLCC_M154]|uniref:Chromosome segregation ATPase n=1 Tax=Roseofilum acuticapitatum BLCC-M154 TaxID=3022444 RepID=A0ABT7ANH7_9CYAN|nr:hypothetical protein [Roseofilum acuticapitatum]MDJ1168004.1 hypothetical protein [Roseofilum acuticapitatum BLCC-M154]
MKEVPTAINPPQETPSSPSSQNTTLNAMGLSLLWLMIIVIFGSAGFVATWLLTRVPPTPNCQELSPLAADGEQLYCVEQQALSGQLEDLESAIAFVDQWDSSHSLYAESQRLMANWSKAILEFARREMQAGNLEKAIEMAGKVPETSPLYSEAQTKIELWQADWATGQDIYEKALKAIESQNWTLAYQQVALLGKLDDPFWSQERFLEVSQLIASEKQHLKQLQDARSYASYGTVADLLEAMERVNKIPADSLTRKTANEEIATWSRELLAKAEERLEEEDLEGAIAIAQKIPTYSPRYAEAQDFVRLGEAINTVQQDNLGAFLVAQTQAARIKPDRPLYEEAQAKIKDWQQEVQDEVQIQFANLIASIGQPMALKQAENFAQMVSVDRPRRIQAQTKVAHWRKEVERLEARPILAMARQVASGETLDDFEKARTLAAEIERGHPLRLEAQTLIAEWNKRIEIIEDGPILERAKSLAKAGDLWEAIEMAEKITSDRALYGQAQDIIYKWEVEIQTAEDEFNLKDAEYLASLGRYNEAIRTASRVGWGRPLYYEAQDAIARWQAKLDALYTPPAPVYREPEPVYQEPVYQEPVYQEPVYQEPVYQEPVYQEPVYQEPVYQEPVYQEPEPAYQEPEPVYEAAPEPLDYSPEPQF